MREKKDKCVAGLLASMAHAYAPSERDGARATEIYTRELCCDKCTRALMEMMERRHREKSDRRTNQRRRRKTAAAAAAAFRWMDSFAD